MRTIEINKENLLELMNQFENDVPYLTALFNKVVELLPTAYVDMLFKEYYYNYIYRGDTYYILQPLVIGEAMYFDSKNQVKTYLKETYPDLTTNRINLFLSGARETLKNNRLITKTKTRET